MLRSARVLFVMSVLIPSALFPAELIPSAAPRGARVIVVGADLDGASLAFTSSSGGIVAASIVARASTSLEAVVPGNAASGTATVTARGATVGTFAFTVLTDAPFVRVATILASERAHDVFKQPAAVAVMATGIAYVADTQHHQIKAVSADGRLLAVIGSGNPGFADGAPSQAQFKQPQAIAIDSTRQAVYVADTGNNAVRRLTAEGVVSTVASPEAGLKQPAGIAVDASGSVYVADTGNHQIRVVSPAGAVTTFAGGVHPGFADGPLAQALFKQPMGIAIDSQGAMVVADSGNNRIRRIADGLVSTIAGTGHGALVDGASSIAEFKQPSAVAVDDAGDVFVADGGNRALRKISGGMVSRIAADAFREPSGVDHCGALLVTDSADDALRAIYSAVHAAEIYPKSGGEVVRIFGAGFVPGATSVSF